MEVSTRDAVFECFDRLDRCANLLGFVLSDIGRVRRGIGFWGVVLSVLLFLNASDEIRRLDAVTRLLAIQ